MEEDEQIRGGKNICWPIRTVFAYFSKHSYCPSSLGQDCCLDVFSDPFFASIMPMSVLCCCMCVCGVVVKEASCDVMAWTMVKL